MARTRIPRHSRESVALWISCWIMMMMMTRFAEAWIPSSSQHHSAWQSKKRPTTTSAIGMSKTVSAAEERFRETAAPGPDLATKPDYENIHGPLGKFMDSIFQEVFRSQLADVVQMPPPPRPQNSTTANDSFAAITELANYMNKNFDPLVVHDKARVVLNRLFPSWMPSSYAVLFSKPFPAFSARMNAWATYVAGTWLMGKCEVNDIELEDESGNMVVAEKQGLLVQRCRFLEEAGCASVCVNSCKIPTQNFFLHDMGLPLTMEPNYETFECQFSFGKMPTDETEMAAKNTPCLARCPTAGALRAKHLGSSSLVAPTNSTCSLIGE